MIKAYVLQVVSWISRFIREKFHSENEDLPYYITIGISAVLFIIALNGFVELTDELAENELGSFDKSTTEFVTSFRDEAVTDYFIFVTHLGDRYAYIVMTVLLAAFYLIKKRSWKFILQTSLVLLLASLSNMVLKKVINRARPSLEHLVSVNTLSYPSGHSMSAMAFYGFLIFLCVRYRMPVWIRYLLVTILTMLVLSIGASRIYLGVHYPSDVAAGFIGGFIWVCFCAVLFSLIDLLRKGAKSRE
jgi:membrane-associated phospholipid phosphatase